MVRQGLRDEYAPMLRSLQFMVLYLILGVAAFLLIAMLVVGDGFRIDAGDFLSLASLVVAVVAVAVRFIVVASITGSGRERIARPSATAAPTASGITGTGDAARLWKVYSVRTLAGAAILEGAAMFAIVAYMLEGSLLSLVVAAILMAGLAMHFPTAQRAFDWLEDQLATIDDSRRFARPDV